MRSRTFISLLAVMGLMTGCSVEKNTLISRTFHNLTSHYNIYFNGYESYKSGVKRAEESVEDNYNRLLPVFYYEIPSVSQAVSGDMDRTLEKATKVISLHSITAKPEFKRGIQTEKQQEFFNQKEYNKWIDDNYILMGKAYVYKNEYRVALETLKKMVADFPQEDSRFEAMIWMARAYDALKEYRDAERILIALQGEEQLDAKYLADFNVTFANHYILQSKYAQAIPYLNNALKRISNKHYKIRYTYLLAQLYELTNQPELALAAFKKVIRMNPPYEMTFNAKIHMASAFQAGGQEGKEIRSLLEKMLKDDKNIDFQDQIYYALGEIALKQNHTEEAITYFKLSAQKSVTNYNQKGLSYIALGDIYYAKPDYVLSQAYYDSSLQNIDQEYENYEDLSRKANSLNHLVEHVIVYTREDSLQHLAFMTEEERFAKIDAIIAQVIQEEEEAKLKKQEELLDMQYGMSMNSNTGSSADASSSGKWYFYNMNAKSFGQPEFRMKWGNRKLEDNWRRANKQSLEFIEESAERSETDSTGSTTPKVLNNKNREYYLKNIPLTDSMINLSDKLLMDAWFNMGLVYRNELEDTDAAIACFAGVMERFPDKEPAMLSAYNLYEIYDLQDKADLRDYHKTWIIQHFPETPRAKILADPGYLERLEKELNQVNIFYEETYALFNEGNDALVLDQVNIARKDFKDHPVLIKFELLEAISRGRMDGKEALSNELRQYIEKYPGTEESQYAQAIMENLFKQAPELEAADTQVQAEEIYSTDSTGIFYVGIGAGKGADINQLKFNLINFNLDNFDRLNLGIDVQELPKTSLIIILSFNDLDMAQRYYSQCARQSKALFKDGKTSDLHLFIITEENYTILKDDQDFRKYLLFFQKFFQP